MMIQRSSTLRGFAASLAVALLIANVARADITWILQPSSTLSISGQLGAIDANNNITELYNLAPETDNNVTLFPGSNNSMSTYSAGTMTSLGNNFLSSLNFGNEPDNNQINLNTAQTVVQNVGDLLPNPLFSAPPFNYGTPIAQNLGAQLLPTGGYANNQDNGGRVSVYNGWGTFSNGTGDKDANTGLHAAVPMAVDATGHFNAQSLAITGQFNLQLSANFHDFQTPFPVNSHGTASAPDGTNPDGFIARANGGDYVLHVPLPAFDSSGTVLAFYYNLNLSYDIVAKANIAPGDANFDGIVNSQDLAAVSSNWLASNPSGLASGDVNGDGIVNSQDLALISSNWLGTTPTIPIGSQAPVPGGGTPGTTGGPPAAQGVPEPGTWVLLGLGSLGLLWHRRRKH